MLQKDSKLRAFVVIIPSLFLGLATVIGSIAYLLPKSTENLNIEFILFFVKSAKYELTAITLFVLTAGIAYFFAGKHIHYAKNNSRHINIFMAAIIALMLLSK